MENIDDIITRLTNLVSAGEDEILDDLVHEAASHIGTAVNNGGFESQVEFLVEQWGSADATKAIMACMDSGKEIIKESQ